MKGLLRRIRGALGMGLTWAVGWFGVGALIGVTFFGGGLDAALLWNGLLFAVAGLIGGVSFSTVLAISERRRTLEQVSAGRFAGWGALGGLVVAAVLSIGGGPLTVTTALVALVLTVLGAGSAVGSLALARRAGGGSALESGEPAGLLDGER